MWTAAARLMELCREVMSLLLNVLRSLSYLYSNYTVQMQQTNESLIFWTDRSKHFLIFQLFTLCLPIWENMLFFVCFVMNLNFSALMDA